MQLLDDKLILSAGDLNNYLACAHLTTLDLLPASVVAEAGTRSLSLAFLVGLEAGPVAWPDLADAIAAAAG